MRRLFPHSLLTVVLCSVWVLSSCSSKKGEDQARPGSLSSAMVVTGVMVHPEELENVIRSSGTVLASESVDLAAEASGRVESISFQEGHHVKKDDLLVKLNDDDLQAQLKKTELQVQLAAEQEQRQKLLLDKSLISKEQYDIAANQLNTLKADHENLLAAVRKREIRAPFDGIIGLRYVSQGGYVSPATRVASIQKINPLKVDFAVPEKYAGRVVVGDSVTFISDETHRQFTGRVYAIEPKIDPETRTLQLRALGDNRSEAIFPGAYVQIELRLRNIADALMIPTQAVIPVLKGQTVLACKNGVAVSVPVKTGIRTASSVQITSGLSPGDTVLTSGLMQLRPGMPVSVKLQ